MRRRGRNHAGRAGVSRGRHTARTVLRLLLTTLLIAPLAAFAATTGPLPAKSPAPESPASDAQTDDPRVIALVFYADWCGSCKALDPRLDAVRAHSDLRTVSFVTLDQTNAEARRQSAGLAETGGYEAVYRANEGKTGFVLLLNAETKQVIGTLTVADSEAAIARKLERAIAST